MKRVLSGVQPSGGLTIGNYLGALRNFVAMQQDYECFFPVVDLHALTLPQDPAALRESTLDVARLFVACGLDPQRATIFVQSHVSAHAELGWLLTCQAHMGELRRMTQFKEKAQRAADAGVGLFTYPVLMAADILLYQAHLVPVGEDQKQHLELTRDLAQRFNHAYGETFQVPEPYIPPKSAGGRIMSLADPAKKMSKSDAEAGSYILLLDPPDVIRKKIQRAVTDSGREVRYDEAAKSAVSNLMVIFSLCTGAGLDEIAARYADRGYGPFKQDLAEAVVATLAPIQARYRELCAPGAIEAVLREGAARAAAVANATLDAVRRRLGMVMPS